MRAYEAVKGFTAKLHVTDRQTDRQTHRHTADQVGSAWSV